MIVPEADAEEADEVAARLRGRVARRGFGSDERARSAPTTGFAMFPADGADVEELLGVADARPLRRQARRAPHRLAAEATARLGAWRPPSARPGAAGATRGTRRAPVFASRLDLEAALAQARRRRRSKSATTTARWPRRDGRLLGRHQVDLGALALEPGELGERRRRLDPVEADQLEEVDRALDVGRRELDSDVVEHTEEFTEMAPTRNMFVCYGLGMEAAVAEQEAGMTEWTDEPAR